MRELLSHLEEMEINPRGTLLVHSSMKAIGLVEGGADAVLDALSIYMQDGLLVLPTHTWLQINTSNNVMNAATEPSCVGLLSNMFFKRPGVIRSLHPTHSVAALGREAAEYVAGEENARTPCWRKGCWGKLYDRKASILFLGCSLKSNTYLHGVEEWCDTPNRLEKIAQEFFVVAPDGKRYSTPQYRHNGSHPSVHYDKVEPIFAREGAVRYGRFGDAKCALCDAVKMADITTALLARNPGLFDDDAPVEE